MSLPEKSNASNRISDPNSMLRSDQTVSNEFFWNASIQAYGQKTRPKAGRGDRVLNIGALGEPIGACEIVLRVAGKRSWRGCEEGQACSVSTHRKLLISGL
jgi:hypothetical protein